MVCYNCHQTQHVLQYWRVLLDFQRIIITVFIWLPSPTVKPPEPRHSLHTFTFFSSNNIHVVHTPHVNLNAHPNKIKLTNVVSSPLIHMCKDCVQTMVEYSTKLLMWRVRGLFNHMTNHLELTFLIMYSHGSPFTSLIYGAYNYNLGQIYSICIPYIPCNSHTISP